MAAPVREHLPDFELAPLRSFDPEILMPRDEEDEATRRTKALVLVLGAIFNDLKALSWVTYQLGDLPPDTGAADPKRGQLVGMHDTVGRLSAGIVHVLANVVKVYSAVFGTPRVRARISRLKPAVASAWKDVLALAHDKPSQRPEPPGTPFTCRG